MTKYLQKLNKNIFLSTSTMVTEAVLTTPTQKSNTYTYKLDFFHIGIIIMPDSYLNIIESK